MISAVAAIDWTNSAIVVGWIALAGTVATVVAGFVGGHLARAQEQNQQVRERMLLAAEEASMAFQNVGLQLVPLFKQGAQVTMDSLSDAEQSCVQARQHQVRLSLLFQPESATAVVALGIVQALERLLTLAKLEVTPTPTQMSTVGDAMAAKGHGGGQPLDEAASWLPYPIDSARWDADSKYRGAILELNQKTTLFAHVAWEALRNPFRKWDNASTKFLQISYWESEAVFEQRIAEAYEALDRALPQDPISKAVTRITRAVSRRRGQGARRDRAIDLKEGRSSKE